VTRKLVETTFVSLDGVIDRPDRWARPFLGDEHDRYAVELLDAAGALLLGRLTYEGLRDFWRSRTGQISDRMNRLPKYVASRTLEPGEAEWNATILEGDVAEAVAKLKAQDGGTILKFGTGELDRTLLEHNLVDEFHFATAPVTAGRGARLFEGFEATLELLDTKRFESGIVLLQYRPK
jgi:dihydrofolate reductase